MIVGGTQQVTWPLVGRAGELRHVAELLADRTAGGIVVAGEPGVGKTRLTAELADAARERGDAVEWVRATASVASIPLGVYAG